MADQSKSFIVSLVGGGLAGTAVDVTLYPLDTIKTRLQSANGFFAAGGFRGVYSGLSAAAAGSAPGAALFFSAYETSKTQLSRYFPEKSHNPMIHMTAASIGETTACLVRVPTEIVKQRMQTGVHTNAVKAVRSILHTHGIGGLYTGYFSMIAREIPFSLIQFPLWEGLKTQWAEYQNVPSVSPFQGALCGSVAGTFAAAVTTPLDVIKTRLMLGADANGVAYETTWDTGRRILTQEGAGKLFSGVGPRTLWIGIGGFVFFGVYEEATAILSSYDGK